VGGHCSATTAKGDRPRHCMVMGVCLVFGYLCPLMPLMMYRQKRRLGLRGEKPFRDRNIDDERELICLFY